MYKRAVSHTLKIQFKKECYCNSTEEKGQSNIVCRTFFKYGRDYWKQMQILSWSKNVLKKIQNIPIINSIKSLEKNAKMKTEKKKKRQKQAERRKNTEEKLQYLIPHLRYKWASARNSVCNPCWRQPFFQCQTIFCQNSYGQPLKKMHTED